MWRITDKVTGPKLQFDEMGVSRAKPRTISPFCKRLCVRSICIRTHLSLRLAPCIPGVEAASKDSVHFSVTVQCYVYKSMSRSALQPAFLDWRRAHNVMAGNDVWIGHRAVILPGVRIGTGVAIGTISRGETGIVESSRALCSNSESCRSKTSLRHTPPRFASSARLRRPVERYREPARPPSPRERAGLADRAPRCS
jgi:hypothetical protein